MNDADTETPFAAHAIVEIMGHVRIAGWTTEATIAGSGFIRVDIPDADGNTKATKYIGPGSIYAITPCDAETARTTMNPPRYVYRPELEAGDDDQEHDDQEHDDQDEGGPF
jgi:hypothetical protein